ncbi:MAG TPA: PadR family transcriptional regulator [Lysinibacillus sp.]|uniref:PadR family transcriptional regulator n=1 Tax=Lysinibacillus fusiformis TaxID=28031 RepID=A0A2I0UZJ3_9BACI|nr:MULTISPECIES: PadR family transcriptional regulator [Lysinibacillus]HBT71854.1 PadR family transcriptional regulator [Lysinibacillus sp.]KUF36230.1 PadR family transcriptional regulator [Lysinibacillus sp. F5]MEE3806505.1 PadR family transcriptional regulator [Lysinibacillus fusiformis]PKU51491.1 PadR family transcriptional regulator [Lysinibacillus fusiformis]WCH49922.1 PadR family transcriptional regulator [Lysinibacillus sp. OF-1]
MSTLLNSLTTELRRGTLTLAVLSQLRTPQYGYSLVQLLEEAGINIDQSTLYPLLRRLEKQELVTSSWDTSESRPRKYYVLSDYGLEVFLQLKREWINNSKELYELLQGDDDQDESD